jgi:undecaprenyl-diphosphatase
MAGDSLTFDSWGRAAVHSWATPALTGALLTITMLGSGWVMLPLGALLIWRLTALGRQRQAMLLAIGGLGAEVFSALLKLLFHRPRPVLFFDLTRAQNYSFPSGHAFVGTVFYGLLAAILIGVYPRRRLTILAATAIVILLIGISRVYLGYHYPSDVLGGWACAAVWLALSGPAIYAANQTQEQRP